MRNATLALLAGAVAIVVAAAFLYLTLTPCHSWCG